MATKVHVRRCHVCGALAEAKDGLVDHCPECGKHLASFYYFNEKLAMSLITDEEARRTWMRPSALPHQEYPPLRGLVVYWDDLEAG